ncbi:UDP-glucose/GDP-mannose dehydrogenase family protein [Candidatus Pacearchaeota archaeon]|nr:UDP-glucose/GDP-mannose dehydrogenase family protein [Candidatus Pacearchaeota archaeon]
MKIGIIGMGIVGGATAKVLGKVHEILPYDKYKQEYNQEIILKESEAVFVCVPTPMKTGGEIDYSAIHDSLEMLTRATYDVPENKKPLAIIRSTAVSGTTDKLEARYPFNFAFNPEFLTEKNALEDMLKTDRIVVGANRKEDYKKVKQIYKPIFPNAKYIHTDAKTAEMIKYTANIMLAGQIALANEFYQICKVMGVDYETVKDTILLDDRIGRNIDVPGPDGDLGFGGKCFPKDLNALIYVARDNMYRPYLLEEIWRLNEKVRKNKDWLKIPGATSGNQNFEEHKK